jgi:hypothetical protein
MTSKKKIGKRNLKFMRLGQANIDRRGGEGD